MVRAHHCGVLVSVAWVYAHRQKTTHRLVRARQRQRLGNWAVDAVARSLRHLLDRHDVFDIA
jgi:hypothetical protein